ncbi:MAG: FAD:protein FMN transferase [Microvirga sp.]
MMHRSRPLLGTYVEITADSAEIIAAGFSAVERIHSLMSAHDPDSELGRLNRIGHREPVEVSPETVAVLERAVHWWRLSCGTFDVAAAGTRSLMDGRIPHHLGQPHPAAKDSSVLLVAGRTVRLTAPACLDLGGIAKGYAVDEAVRAMRRCGAVRGLVNAGGDLLGFGPEPWTISVVDSRTRRPLVEVSLRDEALATSACIDGSTAHLPRGTLWSSVTVRAPSACDADALTKIVWAGDGDAGDLLRRAGARAFGIRVDGRVEEVGEPALAA